MILQHHKHGYLINPFIAHPWIETSVICDQLWENQAYGLLGYKKIGSYGLQWWSPFYYVKSFTNVFSYHWSFSKAWRNLCASLASTKANLQDLRSYMHKKYLIKIFSKWKINSLPAVVVLSLFWLECLINHSRTNLMLIQVKQLLKS